MKEKLGLIATLSLLSGVYDTPNSDVKNNLKPEDIDVTPKEPILPNGCQYYYFDILGDYKNYDSGQYEFKCIAINEKSARKKFNKWLSKNL